MPTDSPGRAMASGMPGRPPPLPTSSSGAGAPTWGRMASESSRWCADGLFRIAQRGQVVGLVPLEEQVAEREQLLLCNVGQIQSESGEARREADRAHAAWDKLWRLRWMNSSETAAGVMPWMREAWPMVCGLCSASFCLTSLESPATPA